MGCAECGRFTWSSQIDRQDPNKGPPRDHHHHRSPKNVSVCVAERASSSFRSSSLLLLVLLSFARNDLNEAPAQRSPTQRGNKRASKRASALFALHVPGRVCIAFLDRSIDWTHTGRSVGGVGEQQQQQQQLASIAHHPVLLPSGAAARFRHERPRLNRGVGQPCPPRK
jgi:hypothetical protein